MKYYTLTYFHTLYKRNVTQVVVNVSIKEGYLHFSSQGRRCAIELKYVVSLVENMED